MVELVIGSVVVVLSLWRTGRALNKALTDRLTARRKNVPPTSEVWILIKENLIKKSTLFAVTVLLAMAVTMVILFEPPRPVFVGKVITWTMLVLMTVPVLVVTIEDVSYEKQLDALDRKEGHGLLPDRASE